VHPDAPLPAYLPAPQVKHVDAAAAAAYFPTSQLVHNAALPVLYFPASQFVQEEEPAKL